MASSGLELLPQDGGLQRRGTSYVSLLQTVTFDGIFPQFFGKEIYGFLVAIQAKKLVS